MKGMPTGSLESYARRIQDLRERNRKICEALDSELMRLSALRSEVRRREGGVSSEDSQLNGLTRRELEVLRCIAEGCSTKEAAMRLAISFKTAACHRHRLMQKVGVHGTGALVRFAIAHRVVAVPAG
jgi:DNA-binding NarL/FixJ family response regulator